MSNKSNHPRTNRKPCIDYTLVEEFIEQNNLTGKSCGYIEKLIHRYYNRHYNRHYSRICSDKGITMKQIQKNADTIATDKLLRFFEDHITDMFDLSDRPPAKIGAIEQDKLCEITYTDDEIAQCLYEIKKRKVAKKIADIRQDFGYEV